jgi:chromosome partitioning protein
MSKVITIARQKGGSGKTTIAANLATVFSLKNNLSTTLLDTDPQGSLGKWFMMRQEKLKEKNTLQFKTASLWGAQYEAKTLKEKCDVVLIDTPPKIDADGRPAIEIADLVIIPISPSQVDFWATESIIELAKREKKEILILINRANSKSKLIQEAVKFVNDMGVKKAKTILGNRQIFVSSMGLGLTVVEKQRTGKGCLEMLSLAKEIKSLLHI